MVLKPQTVRNWKIFTGFACTASLVHTIFRVDYGPQEHCFTGVSPCPTMAAMPFSQVTLKIQVAWDEHKHSTPILSADGMGPTGVQLVFI